MRRFVLSLVLLAAIPCFAQGREDPEIRIGELENGVTYYVAAHVPITYDPLTDNEAASPNRASLRLVVPVGSNVEKAGEEGIAHLIEHLVFHGTKEYDHFGILRFLGQIGAAFGPDANAYTSFNETVYQMEVPVKNVDRLRTALEIFAGWLTTARLSDDAIESERAIVLEERRGGLGAEMRVAEQVLGELFAGTPYGHHMPIGFEKTIQDFTPDQIRNFYGEWYQGAPAAVMVVGDIDPDEIEELIGEIFGPLPQCYSRDKIPQHPVIGCDEPRMLLISDPELQSTESQIIYKLERDAQDLRSRLLDSLLEYVLDRRFERLEDEGELVGGAFYDLETFTKGIALRTLYLNTSPEELLEDTAQMLTEARRMAVYGVLPAEFARALEVHREGIFAFAHLRMFESIADLADECVKHFLGQEILASPFVVAEQCVEILDQLTLEELCEYAKGIDLEHYCTILITQPDGQVTEPMLRGVVDRVLTALVEPPREPLKVRKIDRPAAGMVVREQYDATWNLTQIEFENGAHVYFIPTSDHPGRLDFAAFALGGISDSDQKQLPSAMLAEDTLNFAGIGELSPARLRREPFQIERAIGPYSRELRSEGVPTKSSERLLELVHLAFTAQSTGPENFSSAQEHAKRQWARESNDPRAVAARINSQDHPLFRLPHPEEIEDANYYLTNRIACEAFHNPADFAFVFAGDFDQAELRTLVAAYIGGIPALRGRWGTFIPADVAFPPTVEKRELHAGSEPKCLVQFSFPISIETPSPDQCVVLEAAAGVIEGRLYNLLREVLTATYHVQTDVSFHLPDTRFGILEIQFACDPEDGDLLANLVLRELRLLKEQGVSDLEADALRRQTQRRYAYQGKTSAFMIRQVVNTIRFGWALSEAADVHGRADALTAERISQAVDAITPLDRYTLITLYPSKY